MQGGAKLKNLSGKSYFVYIIQLASTNIKNKKIKTQTKICRRILLNYSLMSL